MRRIGMGGLEDLDYLVKQAESELKFAKEELKFCKQMLTTVKISMVFIVIWYFLIIASFFVSFFAFDNTLLTYTLKVIGMILVSFFFIKGFKKAQINYNNAIRNVNNASDKLEYLRCLAIR